MHQIMDDADEMKRELVADWQRAEKERDDAIAEAAHYRVLAERMGEELAIARGQAESASERKAMTGDELDASRKREQSLTVQLEALGKRHSASQAALAESAREVEVLTGQLRDAMAERSSSGVPARPAVRPEFQIEQDPEDEEGGWVLRMIAGDPVHWVRVSGAPYSVAVRQQDRETMTRDGMHQFWPTRQDEVFAMESPFFWVDYVSKDGTQHRDSVEVDLPNHGGVPF